LVLHDPVPLTTRFSNGRLNFKHLFWAAAGREKGIFAAVPLFFGPGRLKPAGRDHRLPNG
jgi:hypothetical protein